VGLPIASKNQQPPLLPAPPNLPPAPTPSKKDYNPLHAMYDAYAAALAVTTGPHATGVSPIPAATAFPPPPDARETSLSIPLQTQIGNACGTTSLSMLMTYYGAPASVSRVETIDAAIRPHNKDRKIDSFAAPLDLANYARKNGFRATMHNESSLGDLKEMVDQGTPPLLLFDVDAPKGTGLHWSSVSGYKETKQGGREWIISDSNGYHRSLSDDEMLRQWSDLHVNGGIELPYNRFMIVIAPTNGKVKSPSGTSREAATLRLPAQQSPIVADYVGSAVTSAIGVAATAYDDGKAVVGAVVSGSNWVQKQASITGNWVTASLGSAKSWFTAHLPGA
jgi:hypothetical protein